MLKKSFFVLMAILCACAKVTDTESTETRGFKAFNRVEILGPIDVNIENKQAKNQVVLKGDSRDLAHTNTLVENGQLRLAMTPGYPKHGKVHAIVRTRYLNELNYSGHGFIVANNLRSSLFNANITNDGNVKLAGKIGLKTLRVSGQGFTQIKGVSSRNLNVKLQGAPQVQIEGFANLNSLEYSGAGFLKLFWVNSKKLSVKGRGNALVELAGRVNELHLNLANKAQFNGQYLRAKRGFIKTHDAATARVQVINKQHTLASEQSNIYFYNAAHMQTDFMADNGAVLDMQDRAQFASAPYEGYH